MIVLKIFGIILLIIVVLILFLLCILFFVPFCYKGGIRYNDNAMKGGCTVSWLFKAVKINVIYHDDIRFKCSIFGKNVIKKKIKMSKISTNAESDEKTDKNIEKAKEDIKEQEDKFNKIKDDIKKYKNDYNSDEHTNIKKSTKNDEYLFNKGKYKTDRLEKSKNKKSFIDKTKDKLKDIVEKVKTYTKSLQDNVDKIKIIINLYLSDENREYYRKALRHGLKLIRHIYPNSLTVDGRIGIESLWVTSIIYSIFAVINPNICEVNVLPILDNNEIDIKLKGKGRIYLFYIIYNGLRVILDKRFRKIRKIDFVKEVNNGK